MFSRIRLIKVSDQLQAGAKARQTGQRSQRQFRPTFDLLSVIQHQGRQIMAKKNLDLAAMGLGGMIDNLEGSMGGAASTMTRSWTDQVLDRCESLLRLSGKTLMRNRNAPGDP